MTPIPMNQGSLFIDSGYSQCPHFDEKACGDAVALKRIKSEDRLLAVLADGLGHGLKANILALMTTTMAIKFIEEDREIVHSAEIIMDALPVCRERKISYATFTIVDSRLGGLTRIVEMGNPGFILIRDGRIFQVPGKQIVSPKYQDRAMTIYSFYARPQDRVVILSDGVTQAGLGTKNFLLGWGNAGVGKYIADLVKAEPDISSQELSERIVREAIAHEEHLRPADDITALTLYYRKPHQLFLFTGPPFDASRDAECAHLFERFQGTKVICGGTSAEIIARELSLPLDVDLSTVGGDLPPSSTMPGAALVTEGIFTLTKAARYLEAGEIRTNDPAGCLAELMRKHDVIEFLVGTRINEAHQDPNLPIDLELRRNIVKRLADLLRDRYTKEVSVRFV